MKGEIDPVTMEIVRYALSSVVDEMSVTMARAAFSTNIKTRFDMSCALFDRDCCMIAYSEKISQPAFIGALVMYARKVRETYGEARLKPGDMLVVNDPFLWATHLPDIALFAPVFSDGHAAPVAYLMCIGHHSDFGGRATGGWAGDTTDVYQEGLILPPVRLVKEGVMDQEILELILANVRTKEDNAGDFMAQVACIRTGDQRFKEVLDRYGVEELARYTDALLNHAEQQFGLAIAKIPPGRYRGEDWLDDDGIGNTPISISLEMVVGDGKIVLDFTNATKQTRGPANCTPAQAYSKAFYAIKAMIDPDGIVNGGNYRRVELIAPEGSIVNPRRPAPVAMGWETSNRVQEAALMALAEAMPDRAAAQCKRTTGVTAHGGFNLVTKEPFAYFEGIGGGYGARATKDGIDGINAHSQNTCDADVEEMETSFPVRVERFELIPDSEGPGRFRGGLGICKEVIFPGHETGWQCAADGRRFSPRGVHGGGNGRGMRYVMADPSGEREISTKGTVEVPADIRVRIETPGGGGYGDPLQRLEAAVLHDVRQQKLSLERAQSAYGVVIEQGKDGALTVSGEKTAALRRERLAR